MSWPVPLVFVNGVPDGQVPADDPAVTHGMAVFEVARTYNDVPFRLDRHLGRLAGSAKFFGIPWRQALVEIEIAQALSASSGDRSVAITLTAGGLRIVRVAPIDLARVGTPVRLASCRWTPPSWLPGWVKHTARAPWLLAVRAAAVDEVLFVDDLGYWTEASRSNLVVVRQGHAQTPPDDGRILRGVTRGALLDAAKEAGIQVVETPVLAGHCDELYVVSTLKELAPVASLDGVNHVGPGPIGAALASAFHRLVQRETQEVG